MEYQVEIKVEHRLTFRVDATNAAKAALTASTRMMEDTAPDETSIPDAEVVKVTVGPHEVDLVWLIDWKAPRHEDGSRPWTATAYVGRERVCEGDDLTQVLEQAENYCMQLAEDTP